MTDLTGKIFGRLTVVSRGDDNRHGHPCWRCICTCGKTTVVVGTSLTHGDTKSCGCWRDEERKRRPTTHGQSATDTYRIWQLMRNRCLNPHNNRYQLYAGRGITVCDRWLHSFEAFLADMGPRPSKQHSLDRYPLKDGNYEPGNVRWATPTEQSRNRRYTRLLTFQGTTMTIIEWAEALSPSLGLTYRSIYHRLRKGWSVEAALTTPHNPNARMLTYHGVTQSMNVWAHQLGLDRTTIRERLKAGWTVDEALSTPPRQPRRAS